MQPLHIQVQSSLQCIIGQGGSSSSSSSPESIHLAQQTLLALENDHVDEYVSCLLSLLTVPSSSEASKLRLVAILTLKAAILRRWKDRGRGGGGGRSTHNNTNESRSRQRYLSESVKQNVRMSLLNLVTARNSKHHQHNNEQYDQLIIELQQDRQLQHNVSAVLAKIGRLDLPLKFHDLIPTLVTTIQECQQQLQQRPLQQQQQFQQQDQDIQLQQTIQYNTMHTLETTLSEISTQRLLVDKKYRYSIGVQYTASIVEFGLLPSLHCLTEDILLVVKDAQGQQQQDQQQGEEQRVLFMIQYAILASKVVDHLLSSSLSKLVGVDDKESTSTTGAASAGGEGNTNTRLVVDHTMELIHKFLSEWLPRIIDNSSSSNSNNNATIQKMKELLQLQCEMIVSVHNLHPLSFIRYLEPYLTLFYMTLMSLVERQQFNSIDRFDGLMITHLTFLGYVVNTTQYYKDENALTIVWGKFYNPQMMLSLSHTLLVHLFNNGTHNEDGEDDEEEDDEYQQWWKDPEAYFQWENQRSSDEDVSSAAQNLFLALLESKGGGGGGSGVGKEVILPWLINMLGNVASQRLAVEIEGGISRDVDVEIIQQAMPLGTTTLSFPQQSVIQQEAHAELSHTFVMQWDALYTAAGLAGSMLEAYSGFDFGTWFENCLGPNLSVLLQQAGNDLPILQRRIVWLISCNANQINISSHLNPLGMVAAVLSLPNGGDLCLRLTAVQAMDALLPYCEDAPQLLHSITEVTIPALYQLTNDCSEVESRASCLDLLSNIITYASCTGGNLSAELLNNIVAPLSTIWENATDQNLLLRRNVLSIISCVASFVGPNEATSLYPLALPMIDDSFGKEENVFLVDEALKIWWVFLQLSRGYDPLFGKLYLRATVLSKDLEHIKILMRITEHYIILGREAFLNDHAATIQSVLSNVVGEVSPLGAAYVGLVLEALLRMFPSEGGKVLHCCGIVDKFLEACGNNYFGIDSCDPDRVVVIYMTALARIILANPDFLQSKLPISLQSGMFGHAQLVDLFVKRFQVAGNGAHGLLLQSFWGMLLLSFYPPSRTSPFTNAVLGKSNAIFSAFVYLLRNVNSDGSNILSYEVEFDDEEEIIDRDLSAYDSLVEEQTKSDKLLPSNFRHRLKEMFGGLGLAIGSDEYNRFMTTIDNDTLQQLQQLLSD